MTKARLKVLLTTCGGLTSPELIRALKNNEERRVEIIGCDAFPYAVGRHFCDEFKLSPNSSSDEPAFINFISNLSAEVDAIIPCGNEDNLALSLHKSSLQAPLMAGDFNDLTRAYDKGAVYNHLSASVPECAPKFRIIKNFEEFRSALNFLNFPNKDIVIKPRHGRGGRGVYIISDHFSGDIFSSKPEGIYPLSFIENFLNKDEEFDEIIMMECLREPIYSLYSLCLDGKNIVTLKHIREWGNASQTFRALVSYDPKLEEIASSVIEAFNLTYTNNMELATNDEGRPILFDLNPRLGASSGADRLIGLNFPYLALKLLLGEKVEIDKSKFLEPQRFERYFDLRWD